MRGAELEIVSLNISKAYPPASSGCRIVCNRTASLVGEIFISVLLTPTISPREGRINGWRIEKFSIVKSSDLSSSAPLNYPPPGDVGWRLHATGMIRSGREEDSQTERLEDLRARCREHLSVEDHYHGFMEKGIDYGPSFQGIEQLMTAERESLGFLRANGTVEAEMSEYGFIPDCSMQVCRLLRRS